MRACEAAVELAAAKLPDDPSFALEAEVAASYVGERHEPFPVGFSEIARVIPGEGWHVCRVEPADAG